jgi:acyl-CoA hydrolase
MHIQGLPQTKVSHLVRSSDLNRHGTLVAGQMSEWVMKAGFIGTQRALDVDPTLPVCLKIHGLIFTRGAVNRGTVELRYRVAPVGRTSSTVYAEPFVPGDEESPSLDGFPTFVHGKEEQSSPHGLGVEWPTEGRSLRLWRTVQDLRRERRSSQAV